LLVFFFFSINIFLISALTVGSDSVPSREASVLFLAADTDNEMNGFAAFEKGFAFSDDGTTCTFDSMFPVSGGVDMKNGVLKLQKDLIFDSQTTLTSMGNVYGNGFQIGCSESVTTLTTVGEASGYNLQQIAQDTGAKVINVVGWSYDDAYIFNGVAPRAMEIFSFNGTAITPVDSLNLGEEPNSIMGHPTAYYFAVGTDTKGNAKEISIVKLTGSTLSIVDQIDIDVIVRSVAWSADGGYVAIGGDTDTRVYSFNIGAETITPEALLAMTGSEEITVDAIRWDQTGDYYAAGITDATSSKLRIYNFSGSTITAKDYVDTGSDPVLSVDWSKTGSWIAIGTGGTTDQVRVYEYDSSGDSLTEKAKASTGSAVNAVSWDATAEFLVVATELDGSGSEMRVFSFDQDTSALAEVQDVELSTNVNSVRFSHDSDYIVSGDDAWNTTVFSFDSTTALGGLSALLDNLSIFLSNDMSWKMATTVQGECFIDGRDNVITLEDTGVITVTTSAQLTIENSELKGLTSQNFKCSNDNASIVLRNCTIRLDHDFIFDTGSLLFDGDVIFTGTNKFIYSSSRTSTISSGSMLKFDHDTTFSYDPSIANRDLLYMTDETSILHLNGSTLHSTETGIRLTRGAVFLDNAATFSSEGSVTSEAICFGDGTSENDISVKLLSDEDLTLYGPLHYNNTN
jgi:6-phosphogluconolactonase (cycloisomerase 2 family)